MSNHFKVSPFIDEIDVSHINDELYISLKDRDTLIKIRKGEINSLLIPITYATSGELYDMGNMLSDFCKQEFDNASVKNFRDQYKRKYPAIRFGYSAYLGATPEWEFGINPSWDIDYKNEGYFKLTWEPKYVY